MTSSITLWRKVEVGRNKVGSLMRRELEEHFVNKGYTADFLLDHLAYHGYTYTLDLALIEVSQLGFSAPTLYSEIVEKAYTLGLNICPGEVGPELCTQYRDLPPSHPGFYIAMKPVKGPIYVSYYFIFFLTHNRLTAGRAESRDTYKPDDKFVFVLGRSH